MFAIMASLQAVVVGALLLWAGGWKAATPRAGEIAARSALGVMFPHARTVRVAHRAIGILEVALGTLLLVAPSPGGMRMATGVACAFVAYLLVARQIAPDRPCACFGKRATAVSPQAIVRAAMIVALTVVGWGAEQSWTITLGLHPWSLSIVGLEALAFLAVSPEITWTWLTSHLSGTGDARDGAVPRCATAPVPLSDTLHQLQESRPFHTLSRFVRSDVVEHWREGCWRFVCFDAEYGGQAATAIFAVALLSQPHLVRAAVVADSDGTVLVRVEPSGNVSREGASAIVAAVS